MADKQKEYYDVLEAKRQRVILYGCELRDDGVLACEIGIYDSVIGKEFKVSDRAGTVTFKVANHPRSTMQDFPKCLHGVKHPVVQSGANLF